MGMIVAPEVVEETEDNRQTRAAAAALVDAALRARRWTDDDVMKFRAILPRLSNSERPKALMALSQAIDEGRFTLEASVPF